MYMCEFPNMCDELVKAQSANDVLQQALAAERGRVAALADLLIDMGCTEDARDDPVGAAVQVLSAYRETGPWPGKPVPTMEQIREWSEAPCPTASAEKCTVKQLPQLTAAQVQAWLTAQVERADWPAPGPSRNLRARWPLLIRRLQEKGFVL